MADRVDSGSFADQRARAAFAGVAPAFGGCPARHGRVGIEKPGQIMAAWRREAGQGAGMPWPQAPVEVLA